ncbi:unnamed protein product, partial [Phaeothamnion confervicola]
MAHRSRSARERVGGGLTVRPAIVLSEDKLESARRKSTGRCSTAPNGSQRGRPNDGDAAERGASGRVQDDSHVHMKERSPPLPAAASDDRPHTVAGTLRRTARAGVGAPASWQPEQGLEFYTDNPACAMGRGFSEPTLLLPTWPKVSHTPWGD